MMPQQDEPPEKAEQRMIGTLRVALKMPGKSLDKIRVRPMPPRSPRSPR